jgi:hypothetical protein|tara:strand:- start:454 stop:1836 length:1383 start_codon:yes stop_codon:yes gene_type:complete
MKQIVFDFVGLASKVNSFDDLVAQWGKFITITSLQVRNVVNKHVSPQLDAFEEYAKSLDNIDIVTLNMVIDMVQDPEIREVLLEANWNEVIASFRFLTKIDSMDVDHKMYSAVGFRMRIIYEGLLKIQNSTNLWNSLRPRKQVTLMETQEVAGEDQKVLVERSKIKVSKNQVTKMAEDIRRLFIVTLALSEMEVDDPREINELVKDFVDNIGQDQYQIIKDTQVSAFDNKAQIEVQLVSEEFNRTKKGKFETAVGKAASNVLRKQKSNFLAGLKGVRWNELTGSRDIQSEFNTQIMAVAQGKKVKPYSNTTKAKRKVSSKRIKKNKIKAASFRKLKQIKIPPIKAGSRANPNANQERETAKLVTLINKRLPAEVRRNMGRPALINQTGRFSNSVRLESLRATSGGLSGVYNYMTSPYETFENTGRTRWPNGYNPKPLIAKSVRNLAMQYTTQKLASLRRR